MKKIYKIIRTLASRNTNSVLQGQKEKQNNLNSEGRYSLLSQMYLAENENLFI